MAERHIAGPIAEAVLLAGGAVEAAGARRGRAGGSVTRAVLVVVACLFKPDAGIKLPSLGERPIEVRESRQCVCVDLIVIVNAIRLIWTKEFSLRLKQCAVCAIQVHSHAPAQSVRPVTQHRLQPDTAMPIVLGGFPRQVVLQERHAVTAPVGFQ